MSPGSLAAMSQGSSASQAAALAAMSQGLTSSSSAQAQAVAAISALGGGPPGLGGHQVTAASHLGLQDQSSLDAFKPTIRESFLRFQASAALSASAASSAAATSYAALYAGLMGGYPGGVPPGFPTSQPQTRKE